MKLLITGVSGQLGRFLFHASPHETYGTYFTHPVDLENAFKIDLSDRKNVLSLVEKIKPQWIIHCAAASSVEFCEHNKQIAWPSNVMATKNLADACIKSGSRMFFISSEYVFHGREGGLYTEEDIPDPINFYGKTKLVGEYIAHCVPNSIVARTSVLLSRLPGFYVDSMLKALQKGLPYLAIKNMISCPTLISELKEAIFKAIEKNLEGTYHMAGAAKVSRYDLAGKIAEAFGYDASVVRPVTAGEFGFRAPRPVDTSLDISKSENAGFKFSKLEDALKKLSKE